jgi:hypothetical protein
MAFSLCYCNCLRSISTGNVSVKSLRFMQLPRTYCTGLESICDICCCTASHFHLKHLANFMNLPQIAISSRLKRMNSSPAVRDTESVEASSTTGRDSDPAPLPVRSTKDERLVRGARLTVMAVLLLSAVTVAALQYALLVKSEHSSFQAQVGTRASVMMNEGLWYNDN